MMRFLSDFCAVSTRGNESTAAVVATVETKLRREIRVDGFMRQRNYQSGLRSKSFLNVAACIFRVEREHVTASVVSLKCLVFLIRRMEVGRPARQGWPKGQQVYE